MKISQLVKKLLRGYIYEDTNIVILPLSWTESKIIILLMVCISGRNVKRVSGFKIPEIQCSTELGLPDES
jgi:hypothetical protein